MHDTIEKVLNATFVVVLAFGIIFGLVAVGWAKFPWRLLLVLWALGLIYAVTIHGLHRPRPEE
jgi:hypothetical protein